MIYQSIEYAIVVMVKIPTLMAGLDSIIPTGLTKSMLLALVRAIEFSPACNAGKRFIRRAFSPVRDD
ncbi:MAG: hypothetical protein N3A72_07735 [bacterium]|nr:hypothetical protein [bacterium]